MPPYERFSWVGVIDERRRRIEPIVVSIETNYSGLGKLLSSNTTCFVPSLSINVEELLLQQADFELITLIVVTWAPAEKFHGGGANPPTPRKVDHCFDAQIFAFSRRFRPILGVHIASDEGGSKQFRVFRWSANSRGEPLLPPLSSGRPGYRQDSKH